MVRAGAFWTRDFDNRALRSSRESDDERAAGYAVTSSDVQACK